MKLALIGIESHCQDSAECPYSEKQHTKEGATSISLINSTLVPSALPKKCVAFKILKEGLNEGLAVLRNVLQERTGAAVPIS